MTSWDVILKPSYGDCVFLIRSCEYQWLQWWGGDIFVLLQVFLYLSDWWGTTLYISKTQTLGTLTAAMSPSCCETTGTSITFPPTPPLHFARDRFKSLNYAEPPSGHMLRSWEFPTSCSITMSWRCLLTSGSARPTATGKVSQRRFVMKRSRAVVDNDAFVCSLSRHIRVSLWSSTGWWARMRERPTVRLSST